MPHQASRRTLSQLEKGVRSLLLDDPVGPITKRSVRIGEHRTSVTLEQTFWDLLHEIAEAEGTTPNLLMTAIDSTNSIHKGNLSSALRVFCVRWLKSNMDSYKL